MGEAFAGRYNEAVPSWMAARARDALARAVDDLATAEFAWGQTDCSDLIRNRLVGDQGTIDASLTVAGFRRATRPLIVVGVFGAHATIVGAEEMKFSGGYPGAWARALETRMNAQALFLSGAVGSQSAVAAGEGAEGAEAYGKRLAERTATLIAAASWTPRASVASARLPVGLPAPSLRLTRRLRLRPWATQALAPFPADSYVQVLRIGGLTWIGTPCDLSGEIAVRARAVFLQSHPSAGLAFCSFNGDYLGYVTPSKYYYLNEYETQIMGFYGPFAGDYFLDLLVRLASAAQG